MADSKSRAPGLFLTVALAVVAMFGHTLPFPPFTIAGRHPIDVMLLAILLGMVVRNTMPLPTSVGEGVRYSVHDLLPIAIVLLGAKLDFYDLLRVSGQALGINVACVVVALVLTLWLCRKTGVGEKLGLLIGVGTAICGGTAIAVVAPVIEAEERDTAFALGTITLFGLVSVFAFPLIGAALGMSQLEFGVWAGTAVHATPQVMAAGFAYGSEAGDVAVIVKLVRVLLLAPLVVAIGAFYARRKRAQAQAHVAKRASLTTLFPPFIAGFVVVALANTLHLFPSFTVHLEDSFAFRAQSFELSTAEAASGLSTFLSAVAMAGVGLGVHLRGFGRVGMKALYVGLFAACILAVFSLVLVRFAM